MVLGKLPVPGRPTILITVGQGPIALAVGAGGGCLDIFTLSYPFFPLSPSLWETARYRLKYCLKGPLNPKQPTNQPKSGSGDLHLGPCSMPNISMYEQIFDFIFFFKKGQNSANTRLIVMKEKYVSTIIMVYASIQ